MWFASSISTLISVLHAENDVQVLKSVLVSAVTVISPVTKANAPE